MSSPKSAAPTMGRSSILLASGTIVSRVLGFVKAIILAHVIGQTASAVADSFAIANGLPNNVYALIAGGVLGAILVPQIVRAAAHDDGGQRYINKLVTLGVTFFVGVTVVATLAAPGLIFLYTSLSPGNDRGFSPEALALATAFAYWCLPQVFFYALYSLLGEVLNARQVFGPYAWAPVANNVVAIGGIVAFAAVYGGTETNTSVGVFGLDRIVLLAGTATLGIAVQALVLMLVWRRVGLKFRPDFGWRGVGFRATGKAAGWVLAMVLVTQLTGLVQANVASLATDDAASFATIQSSWLIFMMPHSVVAVSIATVFFTRMSRHAGKGDLVAMRHDISSSLRIIGLIIVFAAAALMVVALPIGAVFEQSYTNAQAMALVVATYMIGLVPFGAVFVLQRAFYALEDTRTVFLLELVKSTFYVVGFLLCMLLPVQFIAVGIASVTVISVTIQTVVAFFVLRRRIGPIGGRVLVTRHLTYGAAAVAAAAAGLVVVWALGAFIPTGFAVASVLGAIVTIAASGCVMAAVYGGILLAARNPELRSTVGTVTRRLRRTPSE